MAQAYNHAILPLANERDRRTQVAWGAADFRRRFGREPEGMWLPETAADTPSLEALAEAGIRFTILAPHQAARRRAAGESGWREVGPEGIDTTRAYRCALPSGRSIAIFFYDGPISRAVAFERLLSRGEDFAARLTGAFPARPPGRSSSTSRRTARRTATTTGTATWRSPGRSRRSRPRARRG
jgi:alpha-amylase/alpha-mannosidase (GH57 family)